MTHAIRNSPECLKSELDLFYVPPTNTSVEAGSWGEYNPTNTVENGPLEFLISASESEYIHLNKTLLYLQVSIYQKTESATAIITDKDAAGPINNFASSLFSQADVQFNNESLETSNKTYPYKAYLLDLLNYGEDAKESFMQSSLFYKDDAGQFDSLGIIAAIKGQEASSNSGFIKRRNIILNGSGKAELLTKIHSDIFNTDRYLINNVNVKLTLYRSNNSFCLMHSNTSEYFVKIENATLLVRKTKISPSILLAHQMALEKTTAKYPIKRVIINDFTLSSNISSQNIIVVNSGLLPNKIVFGFVESDAFNGAPNKNPFNFQHFKLTNLSVTIDSKNATYNQPLKFDFPKKAYIRGYNTLFEGIDKPVYANGNYISREDYPDGYALFAYDLSPDLCSGDHFNLIKTGKLTIGVQFSESLKQSITLIVLKEYDNMIEITKNREIHKDFQI